MSDADGRLMGGDVETGDGLVNQRVAVVFNAVAVYLFASRKMGI